MNNQKNFNSFGASLIVLSSVFYASYGIWTKLMGDFFDGYMASVLRSILVVVILFPIAIYYRKFEPLQLKKNWQYIGGMIIVSLFIWGPLYFAILHAGIGISLTINYASIVIGMFFFGWLLAGERFTKSKAISAALGIIGLMLIFWPTTSSFGWLALVAALVSGLAAAANTVLVKQIQYNSLQSTIVLWTTSIIANAIMVFVLGKSYPIFNWQIQWLYLILFAVASVVASWSLVQGLKFIDAGTAGILGLLEIVFGVLFGILLFQEKPTHIALAGIVIIITATAIPYFKDFRARQIKI